MSKVKDVLKEHPVLRFLFMLTGLIISSIGINGFLRKAHLLSGGVAGIATTINYVTGINVGIMTFILNIPIFVLGFIYLENEFCVLSLINMFLFSLILGFTQNIGQYINVDDIFLLTLFGGILNGFGVGMVFKAKASTGGTDIICAILKIKRNIEIKNTSLFINGIIVIVGSLLFGLKLALYTMFGFYLNAWALTIIKDALNYQKSMMIISDRYELIANEIMTSMVRGVTLLDAEGAYTKNKKKVIYTIVSSNEIPKVKEIILKYDKKAFLSVNDVTEIKGRGFKPKDL